MSLVIGKQVVEWVAKKTNEYGNFGTDIGIGWERNGELIAGTAYANWNGVNVEAHVASDGSRKWLTKEYLWTIFDYPFNQLKVNRVTLCIGEGNTSSFGFAIHLGFKIEAQLTGAHPTGDLLVLRMFREECRWIKGFHHEQTRTNLLRAA